MGIGILDDGRDGHILYQSVVYDFVPVAGASSARHFSDGALIVQDGPDTLGCPVAFSLIDREHDIDDHLPVGSGRVVVFIDCFPMAIVCPEDFFGNVVVFDIAKPSVQLRYQNHVQLIPFHVFQKTQQAFSVFHRLSGGNSLIGIVICDMVAVSFCKFCQGFFLRR